VVGTGSLSVVEAKFKGIKLGQGVVALSRAFNEHWVFLSGVLLYVLRNA